MLVIISYMYQTGHLNKMYIYIYANKSSMCPFLPINNLTHSIIIIMNKTISL